MPAPLGNKFARGHHVGRPSEFDIKEEALELIKWSQTDEARILRYFAALRGYTYQTMLVWAEKDEVFFSAFDYARNLIGCRREEERMNANSDSPFVKYLTFHDDALNNHLRAEKKFDASINQSNTENSLSSEQIDQIRNVIDAN